MQDLFSSLHGAIKSPALQNFADSNHKKDDISVCGMAVALLTNYFSVGG